MNTYHCLVKWCPFFDSPKISERQNIIMHYRKHLNRDLFAVARDLGIDNPTASERDKIINRLADFSISLDNNQISTQCYL